MATSLLTPILNDLTRSVNFFNGRLLTGDDLTSEQQANRVARALLGQAIGSGVAYGFEVSESAASKIAAPVVTIKQGLAINCNGEALYLSKNTDIGLVRPSPANGPSSIPSVFQPCAPVEAGPYIAGAAVYVLTVGSASGSQGLAEVSGLSTVQASCNSKYKTEGVQFRLIPIDLSLAELDDVNHLRNLVAYKCFSPETWTNFVTDPFGSTPTGYGLMGQLSSSGLLTQCEVPLAIIFWTATDGLVFVDNWSVRRPVFHHGASSNWAPVAGQRRMVEGLAMFLQFQAHVADLRTQTGDLGSVTAQSNFTLLPPVGLIPVNRETSDDNAEATRFFKEMTYWGPTFMNGARLEALVRRSFGCPPVDTQKGEMVWLYRVRENGVAIDFPATSSSPQSYVVFSSGHLPYQADAQFDLAYFDYSNYAMHR